jgi:hypothetical protein
MIQYGVAVLEKGLPLFVPSLGLTATQLARKCFPEAFFSADCALSWIIWVALYPSILGGWSTSDIRSEIFIE